jgi:hypothetical protein
MKTKERKKKTGRRLAVTVPTLLHTKLKVIAAQIGKTMEDVTCSALEKEVEKHKNCL